MVPMIRDFTMENLIGAINDAIATQSNAEGISTVGYDEQVAQNTTAEKSYEELMTEMSTLGEKMVKANRYEELTTIIENLLGKGKKAGDLKKGQEQIIETLIDDIKEALGE